MKIRFSYLSLLICFFVSLIIVADLFSKVTPEILGYSDEVFSVLCTIILFIHIFKINSLMKKCFAFIFLVLAVGLVGNIISGVQPSLQPIILDLFLFAKPYTIFLFADKVLSQKKATFIFLYMMKTAKIALITMACLAVITLFNDFGMNSVGGYFQLFGSFTGTVSWWTVLFLAVVSSEPRNNRTLYFILSTVIILRSGSGMGMLALVIAILVYFFLEQKKKFRWYYLLIGVPICLFFARNEIADYLMNSDAPRFLLFYYAFITANRFFPFGSGFATYGSAIAIKHYSSLYQEYGFNNRYGMTRDYHPYLMDSYYPQVIGQMGYLGVFFYVLFIFNILSKSIVVIANKNLRCASLYLFICWIVAGTGFGTASAWGCTVYLLIPIFYLCKNEMQDVQQFETCEA